jgi:hypothetical protein
VARALLVSPVLARRDTEEQLVLMVTAGKHAAGSDQVSPTTTYTCSLPLPHSSQAPAWLSMAA